MSALRCHKTSAFWFAEYDSRKTRTACHWFSLCKKHARQSGYAEYEVGEIAAEDEGGRVLRRVLKKQIMRLYREDPGWGDPGKCNHEDNDAPPSGADGVNNDMDSQSR